MTEFIADLHIHSRFSMATSSRLTIPALAEQAWRKGINVLGSGDFTHPLWREEMKKQLVFNEENGFYKYENSPTLFCLQAEISCVYRKNGKIRRNHNLVFAPNLDYAEKLSRELEKYGKLGSDGRPVLSLDARNLLEIVLNNSPESYLIPAHVWTPWYSLFGSKSGFDSLEECFGDLAPEIFALETGLSSDPPMNRLWSALDAFALISNSDAHSVENLAREANLFRGRLSYKSMFQALKNSAARETKPGAECHFMGTLEFYPEEGKYHMDGHRSCGVMFGPDESRELNNICPVCGKALTLGVMHRITDLADRASAPELPGEPETSMLVPLPEIISQILGCKANSARTRNFVAALIEAIGSELDIVCRLPEKELYAIWDNLGEAVSRLRSGNVYAEPGFDGQYGVINIFTPEEQKSMATREKKRKPAFKKAD